jgi:hypothetical protein
LSSAGGNNGAGTGEAVDDMRQFNYYGGGAGGGGAPNLEEFTEADILKLEQEVEDLLRARFAAANNNPNDVVNIESNFRVAKSAHVGKRPTLMSS